MNEPLICEDAGFGLHKACGPTLPCRVGLIARGDARLLGIGLFYLGGVKNKLGLVQGGKDHLYQSLEICRSIGDRFGISMACNSLGLVLQKEEKYADAQQMFQGGLNVSVEVGETWIMQQSLVHLGFSKVALGHLTDARAFFVKALPLASETKLIPRILDCLAGMAQIYAAERRNEPAMDLIVQVEKYPAVPQDTKDRALQLRANLEAQLAPTQIAAIQNRAAEKTLEAVVEELLK